MRTKPTQEVKDAFRELEAARNDLGRGLSVDIDGLFKACSDGIAAMAEEYDYRCGGLDYADQTRALTLRQMRGVRRWFTEALEEANDSPLGWPRMVMTQLRLAAGAGRLSRLDLLTLASSCEVMRLYDKLYILEDKAVRDMVEMTRDRTLHAIFSAYGKGFDYTPLSAEDIEELLDLSATNMSSYVDRLPHSRADADVGLRRLIRSNVAGGLVAANSALAGPPGSKTANGQTPEGKKRLLLSSNPLAKDAGHWLEVKGRHEKANARTELVTYSTKAQERGLAEAGVEWVMIDNPLDERTTEICWRMFGTILRRDECVPGETAPPFHYNCRSILVPISDPEGMADWIEHKKTLAEWRLGRDKGE